MRVPAGLAEKVQGLVDDAVAKGAQLLAGGVMPPASRGGQFYPPTVLSGIRPGMRIWEEEVFGPVSADLPYVIHAHAQRRFLGCYIQSCAT